MEIRSRVVCFTPNRRHRKLSAALLLCGVTVFDESCERMHSLQGLEGTEFTIIMPNIESLDDPTNLAGRIAAAVAEPFIVENVTAEFGVGIGIAIAPNDGVHADELVRRADRALYRAKAAGRSSVRFFEPEMDSHVERRIQIERDLRSAIASNGIVPHYQPRSTAIASSGLKRWHFGKTGI
jgi:predicted signal transduction protein with EAL and GGDEF domain